MRNAIFCFVFVFIFALLATSCKREQPQDDPNVIYTCSMDPQVVEHHPGKCPICHMELTKVSAIPDKNDNTIRISDAQKQIANIKTEFAEIQEIGTERTFPSVVVVNRKLEQAISSKISGRIEKLYHRSINEAVIKGSPLYQIYSEELISAETNYLTALQQQSSGAVPGIDYKQLTDAARRKLILWGLTETQIAELESSKTPSHTLTVLAGQSGIITEVSVVTGDYVMEGTTLYKLADLSTVWVEAQVYSTERTSTYEGMIGEVTFPSLPNKKLEGKISFENPELLGNSKLALIRIEVLNEDRALIPGMLAYVSMKGEEQEVLAVASSAIIHDPSGPIVWIKKKPGVYEPRMVEIGMESRDFTEIVSGLEEGDAVVTSGAYLLQSEYVFKKGQNPMAGMDHGGMKM